MKEISSLIAYRPDVKVVDATLRDGGLVNDFYFTDEFVKALSCVVFIYRDNLHISLTRLCISACRF